MQPSEYNLDFCEACRTTKIETREFVTRENEARHVANASLFTQHKEEIETGKLNPAQIEGLKPLIDMSTALREALLRRAQHTNSGHADPRAPFEPGFESTRYDGLGMGAKVPASADISGFQRLVP
jgi:hypothetical protein